MAAMSPLAGAGAGSGQQPDFGKLHAAERDNLELVGLELLDGGAAAGTVATKRQAQGGAGAGARRWVGDGVEKRVLAMYGKA